MTCVFTSPSPEDVDLTELYAGAALLGMEALPQAETIARVCQARDESGMPAYRHVAVQSPRRAGKSTSLAQLALGRMASRPGYRIISTAQTGDIARRMWREEVVQLLDARFVGIDEEDRPYTARVANGTEVLRWENGSTWRPVTPSPLSYRSQAADLLLFEESGHIAPALAADLRAGAFPTMTTRPGAQAWIVGTPGQVRAGLLWDALVAGREGRPRRGAVDWTIGDSLSIVRPDGTLDEELLAQVHPGIGTLTTMAVMLDEFAEYPPHQFAAEYAGVWPPDGTVSAIDPEVWAAAEVPQEALPERVALAFDVEMDGTAAALCAAWKDEDGVAYVGVVEHRAGISWLPATAHAVARKHKAKVRFDAVGGNHGPAGEIARRRPTIQMAPGGVKDAQAAAQLLVSELEEGRVKHFGQTSLNAAAKGASWRLQESGRLFARRRSAGDVSPLVAASLALYELRTTPERRPITMASA